MSAADASGQYFSPEPEVRSAPRDLRLVLPGAVLSLRSDRGVFAHGGIDTGTRYLLVDGPRPDPACTGDLLDLGCGYGPIALALATWAPAARIWAVDVNERALDRCRENAERNGLTNVVAARPDEVPDGIMFAGVWSNPPIRIGKGALHDLLERWLARRADGAVAVLVVARNLGADSLARWLEGQGHVVERLGSRAGYRLLEIR